MSFQSLRDQFTLTNAHLYLTQSTLQPFVFFASNVPIKSELAFSEETSLEKTIEGIFKAKSVFGIKIIRPLRTLLMRMLEANLGFTVIHTVFLGLCKEYNPTEALPVLSYPGMFKYIKKGEQIDFLVAACDVYIMLRKYDTAYETILKAARMEVLKSERHIAVYKRLIVLSINQGRKISEFKEVIEEFSKKYEMAIDERTSEKKLHEYRAYHIYLGLKEWRALNQNETIVLKNDILYEAFVAARFAILKNYIQVQIKGINWRIKADSIKNQPVSSLQVIKGVNQSKEIYRYDCQQKIMYFNHKQCDQNSLNQLISKAFLMQNQATHCKIQRKELEFGGARMFGGGLGGFGGGMFGGGMMGGFGGFGDFGGSRGKRQQRFHDEDDM